MKTNKDGSYTVPVELITNNYKYGRQVWYGGDARKKQLNPSLIAKYKYTIKSSFSHDRDYDEWYKRDNHDLEHAARVRYLIQNSRYLNKPIRITTTDVNDGNHRLTAHVFLKKKTIKVVFVSEYAKEKFKKIYREHKKLSLPTL